MIELGPSTATFTWVGQRHYLVFVVDNVKLRRLRRTNFSLRHFHFRVNCDVKTVLRVRYVTENDVAVPMLDSDVTTSVADRLACAVARNCDVSVERGVFPVDAACRTQASVAPHSVT